MFRTQVTQRILIAPLSFDKHHSHYFSVLTNFLHSTEAIALDLLLRHKANVLFNEITAIGCVESSLIL